VVGWSRVVLGSAGVGALGGRCLGGERVGEACSCHLPNMDRQGMRQLDESAGSSAVAALAQELAAAAAAADDDDDHTTDLEASQQLRIRRRQGECSIGVVRALRWRGV